MDLAAMRARVRSDLRDSDATNERWSDDELTRHLQRALQELSLAAPLEATATLTTAAGSRDLDVSALSGRVTVDAVEYPTGQYPPAFAAYSLWGDTLTLLIDDEPGGGESVAVYYLKLHTLDEASSTLPGALEDLVATGAGAYAALEWASFATNRVNVGGTETWRHYHIWAQERLATFARAGQARARAARALAAAVPPGRRLARRPAARRVARGDAHPQRDVDRGTALGERRAVPAGAALRPRRGRDPAALATHLHGHGAGRPVRGGAPGRRFAAASAHRSGDGRRDPPARDEPGPDERLHELDVRGHGGGGAARRAGRGR